MRKPSCPVFLSNMILFVVVVIVDKSQRNRGAVVTFYLPPFEDDQQRQLRELFKNPPDTPRGRAEYYMQNPPAVQEWIRHSVTNAQQARESGNMVLDYEPGRRGLQQPGGAGFLEQSMILDFIDCKFYNNSQGPVVGDTLTQQGVISALTQYCPMSFRN
jgi:hypothetical protein